MSGPPILATRRMRQGTVTQRTCPTALPLAANRPHATCRSRRPRRPPRLGPSLMAWRLAAMWARQTPPTKLPVGASRGESGGCGGGPGPVVVVVALGQCGRGKAEGALQPRHGWRPVVVILARLPHMDSLLACHAACDVFSFSFFCCPCSVGIYGLFVSAPRWGRGPLRQTAGRGPPHRQWRRRRWQRVQRTAAGRSHRRHRDRRPRRVGGREGEGVLVCVAGECLRLLPREAGGAQWLGGPAAAVTTGTVPPPAGAAVGRRRRARGWAWHAAAGDDDLGHK